MIAPGAAIVHKRVFDSLDYFAGIAKEIPLERLMGLTDGMQDASFFGRFSWINDSTFFMPMKWSIKKRIEKPKSINLMNYLGAYVNGYLTEAGYAQRFLDIMGREKLKYSCAMGYLEIPFKKDKKRLRTKDNIYEILDERKLLVYDDREKYDTYGNKKCFEPRFRLKIK